MVASCRSARKVRVNRAQPLVDLSEGYDMAPLGVRAALESAPAKDRGCLVGSRFSDFDLVTADPLPGIGRQLRSLCLGYAYKVSTERVRILERRVHHSRCGRCLVGATDDN
jgi:hypothetical protein